MSKIISYGHFPSNKFSPKLFYDSSQMYTRSPPSFGHPPSTTAIPERNIFNRNLIYNMAIQITLSRSKVELEMWWPKIFLDFYQQFQSTYITFLDLPLSNLLELGWVYRIVLFIFHFVNRCNEAGWKHVSYIIFIVSD